MSIVELPSRLGPGRRAARSRPRSGRATSGTSARSSTPSAWISTRPARARRRSASCARCSRRPPATAATRSCAPRFPSERPSDVDGAHSQIVEGPISFFSLCEHHALPFHGVAYVGYVAGDEILGISKLTRLVRLYARRFTVQERLGEQIADTLVELVAGPRRRRAARGGAPLHADARRRGGRLADGDDVLARPLRRRRRSAARVPRRDAVPTALQLLWEQPDLAAARAARRRCASSTTAASASTAPCVYANFVETLDGIVSIPTLERSNALVADESDDDKFLMGILRALADVVLIGTGTLLASPKGRWRPEGVYPEGEGRVRRAARAARQAGAAGRRDRHLRRVARRLAPGARRGRDRAHDRATEREQLGEPCPTSSR